MKKIISGITLLAIAGSIALVSCKKQDSKTAIKENIQTPKGSTAKLADSDIGDIHNEAMAAAQCCFDADTSSEAAFVQSVSHSVYQFFSTEYPTYADASVISDHAVYLDPNYLKQEIKDIPTSWGNLPSGYLSNDELQLLQAIRTLILDNNNGTVSNSDYNAQVNALAANTSNLNQMKIAPSVLKIAVASGDYWVVQGNEEPTPSGIAPWVALDAAGALLGATKASLEGADAEGIAKAALIGAVIASTGIVGK